MVGHIIVGDPETGLWHNDCMLPALVRFPLFLISESGVSSAGTISRCTECDPLGDDDEDGEAVPA